MNTEVRPTAIDLFCGAGGMSLGFEQAGFEIVAAVDRDPIHVQTYKRNFPGCPTICGEIGDLSGDTIRELAGLGSTSIDVLIGGPPCGGFSVIGAREPDDPRNALLLDFARMVGELRPKYFVTENVPGLLSERARATLDLFVHRVGECGYAVVEPIRTCDASGFGVPQRRVRVFVLGFRLNMPSPRYPRSDSADSDRIRRPTVWDAIGGLPDVDSIPELLKTDVYQGPLGPSSGYAKILRGLVRDPEDESPRQLQPGDGLTGCLATVHRPDVVRRFAATEPGGREPISRFLRLSKEGLCPTLRAGTDGRRGSYTAPRPIHPVHPRCITVREAARLHSYPDWFRFHPTKWHGFRQVGNSVPPRLARAVANEVRKLL